MNTTHTRYLTLALWISALLFIGMLIGAITQSEVDTWYQTLNRSPLTPPNAVFPVAWSLLYAALGGCGWLIWTQGVDFKLIKRLFVLQLLLNWSWTPLFFSFHQTGMALIVLVMMNVLTLLLIFLTRVRLNRVALLLTPYFLWIAFATYLNFYIWQHQ